MSVSPPERRGVLAGGNWIIDQVKVIDAWPPQDALATILSQETGNGGSPYNLLKNLARFGAGYPLEAVGLVGADAHGQAILADCQRHHIDTRQLQVSAEAATSYTDVMTVQGSGRRTFFHQRGANARLDYAHFDFARTRARHFHLGYLLLLDRLDALEEGIPRAARVLAAARAAGLKTSVDVVSEASDRFQQGVLPLLPQVDCLFANDYETERLTAVPLRHRGGISRVAVERAARALLDAGVTEWVIVHFPEGACACSARGDCLWMPSVRMPPGEIKGAAGAGDALAAGVLHGWHEQWPMANALELGVCAAAASLRHPTCSEGIPSLAECLESGRRRGFHPLPA